MGVSAWVQCATALAAVACGRVGLDSHDLDAATAVDSPVHDDAPDDAPIDAPAPSPRFEGGDWVWMAGTSLTTVQVAFTVPSGTQGDLYLIAAATIGGACNGSGTSPTVTNLSLGGTSLTRLGTLTGTPCNAMQSHSELWGMVDPPLGSNTLEADADTATGFFSAMGLVFSGIDQTSPIRDSGVATNAGSASSVSVTGEPGDQVVDFIADSATVTTTVDDGTFVLALTGSNRGSDNLTALAASIAIASGATTTMDWTFDGSSQYQAYAVSLVP